MKKVESDAIPSYRCPLKGLHYNKLNNQTKNRIQIAYILTLIIIMFGFLCMQTSEIFSYVQLNSEENVISLDTSSENESSTYYNDKEITDISQAQIKIEYLSCNHPVIVWKNDYINSVKNTTSIDNFPDNFTTSNDTIVTSTEVNTTEVTTTTSVANTKNSTMAAQSRRTTFHATTTTNHKTVQSNSSQEYPVANLVWSIMQSYGWNDIICAGIMGNMMAEVGGQTFNLVWDSNTRGYYGLCQWKQLYFPQVVGKDVRGQMEVLKNTLDLSIFNSCTTPESAALAFAKQYERCSSRSWQKRQHNAKAAFDYFV